MSAIAITSKWHSVVVFVDYFLLLWKQHKHKN